jgi:predicted lipase
VAVDDVKKLIVVSFRGSEPTRSTVPDSNTNLDSLNAQDSAAIYCADCAAAKGYYESFMEVNTTVVEAVQAQRQLHADYQVVTTGHSLGGSLSMFTALELRRLGINVHAVSSTPHTHNLREHHD